MNYNKAVMEELREVLGDRGIVESLIRLADTELIERVYNVIAKELYKEEA